MTIQKLPGTAITPGTITVVQLESTVATTVSTGGGPKITNLEITSNVNATLDDTAVDLTGGFIRLTGTGFNTGCLVYAGLVPAASTTFISNTEVRAQLSAQSAGTYPVYLVNTDGGTAIRVPGVTYSASPAWQTASSLGDQYDGVLLNLSVIATDAVTYTLVSGSLPPGLSLNSNTGVISGTISGVANDTVYTFTITAVDAQLQDSPRVFTINVTVSDPYFRLTTLLLTGNSGNTVVTDSSVNNFAITVVGDSRASNFSPYLTGWSNYFDGSSAYLSVADNAAFDFGAGNFTIEYWEYRSSAKNDVIPIGRRLNNSGSANSIWNLGYESSGSLYGSFNDGAGTTYLSLQMGSAFYATWNHYAVVRNGNTVTCYRNGNSVGSGTLTQTLPAGGQPLTIGRMQNNGYYFQGYVSNVRLIKGTALYTANFTPATTTLTSVTNTSLLTCHANRFIDSSTNNFAITRNGDVSVVSFNPFNLTNTGTTGSMYFDGNGDYFSVADNAAFSFGSSDFTIEMWVNTTASGYRAGITKWQSGQFSWMIRVDDSGTGKWEFFYSTTGSNYVQISGVNIKDGAWHHLAVSRSGINIRLFTDGVLSNTNTANPTIYTSTAPVVVGSDQGAQFFNGYISDIRIIKSTAVYTANFTPPTAPLTAIANTSLLTLQNRQPPNNHTFQDSSTNNFLITRNGNATQGTFSPFSQSGWSVYLNGSSSLNVSLATAVGTSDFTFECWLCDTSSISGDVHVIGYNVSGGGLLRVSGTDINWDIYAAGTPLRYSVTRSINTWYHIAYSRQGTTGRLFYNGTLAASQTDSTNYSATSSFIIGSNPTTGQFYPGYVSNARIVIGRAVYTSAFTTPTTLLGTTTVGQNPPQGLETKLLTCQSNRFLDNSVAPVALTVRYGSPSVQAFSPFSPTATYSAVTHGGSAYFDGNDYLTVPVNAAINFGTGDFTIEAWVYPTTTPQDGGGPLVGVTGNILFAYSASSASWAFGRNNVSWDISFGQAPILNTWQHIAVTRSGTLLRCFFNGALINSATNTNSYVLTGGGYVGWNGNATGYFTGYITRIRTINGTALYTAAFTPPTDLPTATTNTSLLLNFTNDAIEDATGRNVIETVGDARTTSAVTKWAGSHSMYFDGTGDYLFSPSTPLIPFGTGDFTIEVWIYPTKISAPNGIAIVSNRTGTSSNSVVGCLWGNSYGIYLHTDATQVLNSGVQPTINVWQHIAYVRSSGTLKIYLNGSQIGSSSSFTSDLSSQASWYVSKDGTYTGSGAETFQGYMQDLRVTRGYARYTANFTAPTAPARLK